MRTEVCRKKLYDRAKKRDSFEAPVKPTGTRFPRRVNSAADFLCSVRIGPWKPRPVRSAKHSLFERSSWTLRVATPSNNHKVRECVTTRGDLP